MYTDFVFECEFKFGSGLIDSGIFLRDERQQVQIGQSGSLKRDMTCSPYIPGRGYPQEAKGVKELLKLKDWNHMRVEVRGKHYLIWLNGKLVNDFTAKKVRASGPIGIQLHPGRVMQMSYRKIKAKELSPVKK